MPTRTQPPPLLHHPTPHAPRVSAPALQSTTGATSFTSTGCPLTSTECWVGAVAAKHAVMCGCKEQVCYAACQPGCLNRAPRSALPLPRLLCRRHGPAGQQPDELCALGGHGCGQQRGGPAGRRTGECCRSAHRSAKCWDTALAAARHGGPTKLPAPARRTPLTRSACSPRLPGCFRCGAACRCCACARASRQRPS